MDGRRSAASHPVISHPRLRWAALILVSAAGMIVGLVVLVAAMLDGNLLFEVIGTLWILVSAGLLTRRAVLWLMLAIVTFVTGVLRLYESLALAALAFLLLAALFYARPVIREAEDERAARTGRTPARERAE